MAKTEITLIYAAIAGVIWVIWARQGNAGGFQDHFASGTAPLSEAASSAPLGGEVSTNVPWFLNYNALPPSFANSNNPLPQQTTGIENTTDKPCSTCSMFGTSFGSQY